MNRAMLFATAFAALLACLPAAAQRKAAAPEAPAADPAPCACPETAPPVVRETDLAECGDGLDNDADGHVDCADQDCDIYAMCAAPRTATAPAAAAAPPAPAKTYATMRELKKDLRAGAITGADFWRWQSAIRAQREAELDLLKIDYRSGRISRAEYRARAAAIKEKYEG